MEEVDLGLEDLVVHLVGVEGVEGIDCRPLPVAEAVECI